MKDGGWEGGRKRRVGREGARGGSEEATMRGGWERKGRKEGWLRKGTSEEGT